MSISATLFRTIFRQKIKAFDFPGPSPTFPLGNALDFRDRKPWRTADRYARQYGRIAVAWLGPQPLVVLNDVDLIEQVLVTRTQDFYKEAPIPALGPVIGYDTTFLTNGTAWRQNRAAEPFIMLDLNEFMTERLSPMRNYVLQQAEAAAQRPGQHDLFFTMFRLVIDTFGVAILGHPLPDEIFMGFVKIGEKGAARMTSFNPLRGRLDGPFLRIREWLFGYFRECVRDTLRNPDPAATDLINIMLRQRGKDFVAAERFNVNLVNMFLLGTLSSASGVANTLYLLARHPESERKVREAVDQLFARPDFDRQALTQCHPLSYAVREALRLLGPVPFWARSTVPDRPVELAGRLLPPDTKLLISNWFLHRDPDYWETPETFDLSRWANGGVKRHTVGSGHYFPFGRGERECAGAPMALHLMRLVLAAWIRRVTTGIDPAMSYQDTFFTGVVIPKGLMAEFTLR